MSTPTLLGQHSKTTHQHRFSSADSLSSSSVVTVQRAASPQSPQGYRSRSNVPNATGSSAVRLESREDGKLGGSPDRKRRSFAAQNRSSSAAGIREGIGNLNRWSQSTNSSIGSSTNRRRNSFSKRLSLTGANPLSPLGGTAASPTTSRSPLSTSRPSTAGSSSRRASPPPPPPSLSTTLLPPMLTLPSLSHAVTAADSSSTPATISPSTAGLLTPSTYASSTPDYFGEVGKGWQGNSPPRKKLSPQATLLNPSPVSQSSSPSSNRKAGFDLQSNNVNGTGLPLQPDRNLPRNRTRDSIYRTDRGHSRSREADGKGSGGTDTNSSISSTRSKDRDKTHGTKHPSQKAMLSKALQKAKTAVLLDNAQNFEGAVHAYRDACALLQKVMAKSSANEERKKLEAIRTTYTNRIKELDFIGIPGNDDSKALPARPESNTYNETRDSVESALGNADDVKATIGTATVKRLVNSQSYIADVKKSHPSSSPSGAPPHQEPLMPSFDFVEQFVLSTNSSAPQSEPKSWSKSPLQAQAIESSVNLQPPMEKDYMPPPLSPRRPLSPSVADASDNVTAVEPDVSDFQGPQLTGPIGDRVESSESTSWLDTIDESGGSSASSVHSRSSSTGVRRKRIRAASGATEAEFDLALDAAVEAAYDDGYEPAEHPEHFQNEVISNVRRNVEMAKQRAREAEREAEILLMNQRERERQLGNISRTRSDSIGLDYDDEEAEEEERMLEEMTQGFVMDDSEFDIQSKSALPRQSDSSGFSGRTWGSSIGSNPTTAATSLQTLPEAPTLPALAPHLPSKPTQQHYPPPGAVPPSLANNSSSLPPPPPMIAPPKPPLKAPPRPPSLATLSSQSVRNRRLSGQHHKQLKIETSKKLPHEVHAPLTQPLAFSQSSLQSDDSPGLQPMTASAIPSKGRTDAPFNFSVDEASMIAGSKDDGLSPAQQLTPVEDTHGSGIASLGASQTLPGESDGGVRIVPPFESPERLTGKISVGTGNLRKNFSSSSLKNRNVSLSSPDGSESSPGTPLGGSFSASSTNNLRRAHTPSVPTLPTPTLANFQMSGLPTGGGLHLFESDIHSTSTPGAPNPLAANPPAALESCPAETILRPFWLMRCLYQTIVHPSGGYLSTKLFVPRDVWRVKGVKIKGVEEKISNCDFLTAALQNLGKVDTFDADAVLEEMQSLESVLDQVQQTLHKKLGNEVGVQGSIAMFKDAPTEGDSSSNADTSTPTYKTASSSSKSGYLSWKRLRSKNSGAGLTNAFAAPRDGSKETRSMSSLPMTTSPTMKFAKRDIGQTQFTGPNAAYMNSLARLFDAAQVLDQIARQVEDPGLKHSSPTQVGLELSTRHAAEFFGLYICRFVLTDISTMIDKFIKRGSEWVLA
ncbi:MAG: hypothetical protein M1837_000229 [Sclerophora amabilis]|nr:MAG: hypothetical protein M1837_000229 [Sclerophora amabilis]